MAKSFPIKIARRCDKSGAAPATPCFAGGSRAGENGARQRAGCRFRVVAPSTHRRAGTGGVAGINETSCILYTSGTTGKPKGVQRDVGGYAVALATSMDTIFGGKAGGVFFCASDIGWVVGHSYIVYAPLLAGMATIVYEGLPTGRTAACGGKSSRNIRLAGCSQRRPLFAC